MLAFFRFLIIVVAVLVIALHCLGGMDKDIWNTDGEKNMYRAKKEVCGKERNPFSVEYE